MARRLIESIGGIPPRLAAIEATPGGAGWLASLPGLLERTAHQWELTVGRAYPASQVSLVVPATTRDGATVVLKIQFPHRESHAEADALRVWDGDAAVRLLDHDPALDAMLLEHCEPGTHLSAAGADEALRVLGLLVPRLLVPATEPFTPLCDEAHRWANGLIPAWERSGRPFESRLVDAAVEALRSLADTQGPQVLLHQDLHADNVVAARREPWLVIDPKPLAGEAAFACAPIIRSSELGHSRSAVLRRLDRLSDDLDVDRERARGWAFAQTVAWSFADDRVLEGHLATARWLMEA